MIIIKLVDSNRWRIIEVELLHNHLVSPEIKRFYKSHKRPIRSSKKAYRLKPVKEIHTIKLYRTAPRANGDSDRNKSSKHLELKDGDLHAVYNYFCRMKLTNPNFFYAVDLDDEGRLKNIFWADGRSKVLYNYFYDTILIDTTNLSNKYETPLVSFIGINHHGQKVLLGCAFLGDKSTDSLTWMFNTWLTCMMGRHPQVIITDRSNPLRAAVRQVFPQSHHCYCLWYIMQRMPEKLGGLKGYETIEMQIREAVYDSLKIVEFESSWCKMIKDHHWLDDNKWLRELYEDRQQWVPVYLNDIFLFLIPMKVNEAFNPFFDGYVHKHTSFKEFLDKYDLALQRNHQREAMEDLESTKNSNFFPKTRCRFETIITYEVLFESTRAEIRCVCGLFNLKGYLCRHALNVLNYNGIEEVPSQYILPRWRRDYKVRSELVDYRVDGYYSSNEKLCWYDHLSRHGLRVVEKGAKSREIYDDVVQELGELFDKISLVDVDDSV